MLYCIIGALAIAAILLLMFRRRRKQKPALFLPTVDVEGNKGGVKLPTLMM